MFSKSMIGAHFSGFGGQLGKTHYLRKRPARMKTSHSEKSEELQQQLMSAAATKRARKNLRRACGYACCILRNPCLGG